MSDQQITITRMQEIISECRFPPYEFKVSEGHGGIHLQATYLDADIVTDQLELQYTRKWLLSPHMTKSEIVQTAFKLVMTSMEHRAREGFKYRGCRVFGPHYDIDALVGLCQRKQLDYRKTP